VNFAFPGFVLGYYLAPDGPPGSAGSVFLTVGLWTLASWVLCTGIAAGTGLSAQRAFPLLGAAAAGLRNVLLVSGDPPAMGPYPDTTAVFDIDSIGLTNVVHGLNRGVDPGGGSIGPPTEFVIGVAANHGALDQEREVSRFAYKVEAGADFAVTQPVFDAASLERFMERVDKWRVPLVAGIWPLLNLRNAEYLANEVPGVSVPDAIVERMRRAQESGADAALAEGVAIACEMVEAVRPFVQGYHISAPSGRVDVALRVLREGGVRATA